MRKKLLQGLAVGVVATAMALALWMTGMLTRFEAKTWDWRVTKLAKPGAFTDRIRVIFIDQYSLTFFKKNNDWKWPWPREGQKLILDFCKRQDAKAVIFDMIYSEPSSWGAEDDQRLGDGIAAGSPFAGTVFLKPGTDEGATNWPPEVPASPLRIAGLEDWMRLPEHQARRMGQATFPIPEVATHATVLGNVEAQPDADAIFRRLPLFAVFDRQAVPFLGAAGYLAARPTSVVTIRDQTLSWDGYDIPLDRRGRAILRFRGPHGTHRSFNAAEIIQSEMRLANQDPEPPPIADTNALRDCYVFLGGTAPGLLDLRPTPVGRDYSGVEINATLLDNLLSRDFMRDAPRAVTIGLTFLLGVLWAVLTLVGRHARDNVIVFVLALPLPVWLCVGAYQQGVWLPFMVLEAATAFALVGSVLLNYATEGKQKRFIRGAFKQYLSEDVIDQIVANPDSLTLGGELRPLTIHFSDIKGFTSISESLGSQGVTALLNEYLTAMTDIIQEEGGTVDKYIGDCVMAFWNAPVPQADHAVRGVRAALRCQRKLAELRPELKARTGADLYCRIGLNTGPSTVGNMGSRNRFNYTIIGDPVNLASRLEGVNKQFGTYAMISEFTREAIGDAFPVRELSRIAVVGRKEPVRVFEPMGPEDFAARRAVLEAFARGLAAYYEGRFQDAIASFEPIQPQDPPAAAYLKRCRDLLAHPPAAWDGVWVMTEK